MTKKDMSVQRRLWTLVFEIADRLRDGFLEEQVECEELFQQLTVRQHKTIRAVSVLTEDKPEGVTLKELAEYLKLAPCSVSETVESLVKLDTLVREVNPSDRRAILITLSPGALKAREAGISYLNRNSDTLLRQLSPSEQTQFLQFLEKFMTSIPNHK